MTQLRKVSLSSLSPELLAEMTEQTIMKMNPHKVNDHVEKQCLALVQLLDELKSAFMREQKSAHTPIIRALNKKRNDILKALNLSLESSIANRMFNNEKADHAVVIMGQLQKIGSGILRLADLEKSMAIKSILKSLNELPYAINGADVTIIINALDTTQKEFDLAYNAKLGSETSTTSIRDISSIRKDITVRYDAINSFFKTALIDTPELVENTVKALNDLADIIIAKQKSEETRKDHGKDETGTAS